ncbi:MAG: septal ring lytic transglycosylase RlpA family protein [Bacteroidota bacterium]
MKKVTAILLFLICTQQIFAQTDTTILQPKTDTLIQLKDSLIAVKDTLKLDSSIKLDPPDGFKFKPNAKVITGIASFYSKNLDGTKTATGEYYRNAKLTAASNNLKLNTWVKVTNISNDKFVIVRINDRMHPRMAKKGRVVDLSRAAAKELDFMKKGLTKVRVETLERLIVD